MRIGAVVVGLWLSGSLVACGASDSTGGSGSGGSSGNPAAQAGAAGSGASTSGGAGSSNAGSSNAGTSGGSSMASAACQTYCTCHEMNCASTAIPGGKSCLEFCAAMTAEQLGCRQNMCGLVPAQPDNDHCTHSVGIVQCICDGSPGSC